MLIAAGIVVCIAAAAQVKTYEIKVTPRCREQLSLRPGKMGFEFEPDRPMSIEIPEVQLTAAEKERLYKGEPISKLLPGPGDRKIGWLRFFCPFDPVTAYWVVTDSPNFSRQDPAFPATGSLSRKRNTYMPYCFENRVCESDGYLWNLQYLVMPLVSPRKVSTSMCRNRDAFPWESTWWTGERFYCEEMVSDELRDEVAKAVPIKRNVGAWHVGPLPEEFRRSPGDLNRSQIYYIVDTDPGGTIGDAQSIVNAANERALPSLAQNVVFVGGRYEWFLKKYHPADSIEQFKAEQAEYRRVWGPRFANAGK